MTKDMTAAYAAAKEHARKVYPEESVGFVIDGGYVPAKNTAAKASTHKEDDAGCLCRLCAFKISRADSSKHLGNAQMILHSHPNGNLFPSRMDMEGQIATGVPWGVIALDEDRIGDPEIWGDQLPIAPLLGRQFMHGIRDCYSVIRDAYRMGSKELAKLDITHEWPFDPITLRDVPRDDAWWETDDDLYGMVPFRHGWTEIPREDAQPGDCFLIKIKSRKFNHAGVMVAQDLIMHHLPGRFSRREPSGLWGRQAGRWLRYAGEGAAYA